MEPMFIVDGAVAAGAEKSNRSADALGAGCDAAVDENTSPNPPNPPVVAVVVGFGAGGDFGAGSKNDPPPSGGAACVAFAAPPLDAPNPPVSAENGDGACWAGPEDPTLSEPNASFRSPNADARGAPDCRPPKPPAWAGCAGCAGCGAAFGADAYSDRMDCLRSDFDGPLAVPPTAPRSFDGRAGAAGGAPKKSRPRRDSAGLVCFAGAGGALDGGCVPSGGPVLGRAGGVTSSPKRSIDGFAGRLAEAGCLWDVERSTFDPLDGVGC